MLRITILHPNNSPTNVELNIPIIWEYSNLINLQNDVEPFWEYSNLIIPSFRPLRNETRNDPARDEISTE